MNHAAKMRLKVLESLWQKDRRAKELHRGGKQRDSLFRALVPLYFTRAENVGHISSCDTANFWAAHGVKVQATVMAKVLREHIGYSRRTRVGIQITPNGVKYVEAVLKLA